MRDAVDSAVPFTDVGAESEVADGDVVARHVAGRDLLLCKAAGSLFAIADRCTHAAWSLAGSELRVAGSGTGDTERIESNESSERAERAERAEIVCGLHGARFDLRTGEPTARPASRPLRVFPVRIRGGRIEVQVTPPPR
jgi:3-phenylpropionate/trans-cinnamate dioxygenase ferredoxin subunit